MKTDREVVRVDQPMAPQRNGHAPGWSWRKDVAGQLEQPWNGTEQARVWGLCESGWHTDCPQAPNPSVGASGTCSCPCHQGQTPPGGGPSAQVDPIDDYETDLLELAQED